MKISDERNAQILISLLKAHGIRHVVISPGATNIPISGSLPSDPFFRLFSAADERSAAYMACGIADALGEPVALSCTGATASRNYLPGLTEAYYRKLPVLAITSALPEGRIGHLFPQSIDRSSPPADSIRTSVTVPVVDSSADAEVAARQINRAILALRRNGGGPAHINLETNYAGTFSSSALPDISPVRFHEIGRENWPPIPDGTRIAVWIGSHGKFDKRTADAIGRFVRTRNAVVLCDHTSSYVGPGKVLAALPCSQGIGGRAKELGLEPELIVHIGEVSGDYPTSGFLSHRAPVWRISADGMDRDRLGRLQEVFAMPEYCFFEHYSLPSEKLTASPSQYEIAWRTYSDQLRSKIPELPFSNAWIAQSLSPRIPPNGIMHFGILNSLRSWNFFEVPETVETRSNVGGFGIDGCLSTVLGASLVRPDRTHFIVMGDLAFFYDMNALGNRHAGNNLRILVVNNGAGAEFNLYNHVGSQFGEQTNDFIAAGGHFGNKSRVLIRDYAKALGFEYLSAADKNDFLERSEQFLSKRNCSVVLECFTKLSDESEAIRLISETDSVHSNRWDAVLRSKCARTMPTILKRAVNAFGRKDRPS